MKSRIFLTSYNLSTFLIVSLFLQNFECSKWENHVFMEFLLSFFQCCFMSETQVLMTVFNFSWFFSRNHFLKGGFTFQCRGGLIFGWGVSFLSGESAPRGHRFWWGEFQKKYGIGGEKKKKKKKKISQVEREILRLWIPMLFAKLLPLIKNISPFFTF